MRVPISWLRDYVELTLSPEALAELLTGAGLEVTALQVVGLDGAPLVWDPERIKLARLLEVRPHPDADRLVLATVDGGLDAPKVVVTGAPNLVPYLEQGDVGELGLFSPLLLEGATYLNPYKEGRPTKLKGKELRGIYNDAMLASPAELGLGEDHDGIILMQRDEESPEYVAGTPLRELLGDAVLDIDIIPNISRCASILGVAREVAALTESPLNLPSIEVVMEGNAIDGRIRISTEEPALNPRFVAMLVEGVEQRPSPFWMQHRLRLCGQRPINAVVDVSNYVLLEIGQPNHTYDYDFLRQRANEYAPRGPIHLCTRLAGPGERITTLDGTERELYANNILVADAVGNLGLGGVMGGAESEIRPETTHVLIEAAAWDFINIRQTSRQLGLNTEAAYRFGRGVHPSQALLGAKRAAELLRRLAGGTVAKGIVDFYPRPAPEVRIDLSPAYVQRLTGLQLSKGKIADLLSRAYFEVEEEGKTLAVTTPDHRLDVEGPHDLVEEICRMYGYDRLPSTVLRDRLPPQRGNPTLEREERIRDLLVGHGLHEVITYRLTTPEAEGRIFPAGAPDEPYIRLANPSSSERVVMRRHLLPSVLEVAAANSRFQDRIRLFELGQVFPKVEDEALPEELLHLVVVMTGHREEAHWKNGETSTLDYFDLKGVVEALCESLKLEARFTAGEDPSFRPGRTAHFHLGESIVGVLGELHPRVVAGYDFRLGSGQAVLGARLDLEPILPALPDAFAVEALPVYPAVHEDLALIVDRELPAAEVTRSLLEAGAPLLRRVDLFDVYTGDQVAPEKKSLAYHLTLQSPGKTLKDRDAERLRSKILKQIETQLGATLRES